MDSKPEYIPASSSSSSSSSNPSPPFDYQPPQYTEAEQVKYPTDEKVDPTKSASPPMAIPTAMPLPTHPAAASPQPPKAMTGFAIVMNLGYFFVGGGIFSLIVYLFMSAIFALTIIGWPLAVDLFRAGLIASFPFGRQVVPSKDCGCKRFTLQIIWLPFGIIVYLNHLFFSIMFMLSLVFIPFGLQHLALAKLALWPFDSKAFNKSLEARDLFSVSYFMTVNPTIDQNELSV